MAEPQAWSDAIEVSVALPVPIASAWQAIGHAAAFGTWFGVRWDGEFAQGAALTGRIEPTKVDPDVARSQEPYRGTKMEVQVERVEAPRLLVYRWHPFAVDAGVDYSQEKRTRVSFALGERGSATQLVITESGFSALPPQRRAAAYGAHLSGWQAQAALVRRYLEQAG